MNKKAVFAAFLAALALSACTKQLDLEEPENKKENRNATIDPNIEFADVMYFSNEKDLQDLINNDETSTVTSIFRS